MDAEQTIAEIEWLERTFAAPDTRPFSASDLAAANRKARRNARAQSVVSPSAGFWGLLPLVSVSLRIPIGVRPTS